MIQKTRNIMLVLILAIMLSGCLVLEEPQIIQEDTPEQSIIDPPAPTEPPIEPIDTSEPEAIDIPFEPTSATPDPDNLVQNGYFLEDYEFWARDLIDEGGSSKIRIANSANSNFDRELQMEQSGKGFMILRQTLPIPSLNLTFSATFKMTGERYSNYNNYGSGMVVLIYEDVNHEALGYTPIMYKGLRGLASRGLIGLPEDNSDTNRVHNIWIDSGKVYKDFSIELDKEIRENLLGVDPAEVTYITIALVVGAPDSGSGGTLTISDIVIK
jgi:hypothetical protein